MTQLRSTIAQGEGETIEFKTSFNDEVIISLVAFANTKGGSVYIGVADDGAIKGVKFGKETLQNWANEIKNKTTPSLIPEIEIIEVNDKEIAIIELKEYPIKPVAFRGKYYKRNRNSNHQLSVSEVAEMHLRTVNSSWDYHVKNNLTIADISNEKVQRSIDVISKRNPGQVIDSPEEFLKKHELVKGTEVTNGCFLMFNSKETYHTTIQMGLFASETVIKDDVTSTSDIISQVDEVIGFIVKHINKEIIITGRAENTERWQYPLEAIREIVVNMIVHRDYMSGRHATVKVFPNHIIFYNPGTLPADITLPDLLADNYISSPRNLQIAKIFKEMGLIERYGTGIKRIRKMFLEHQLPEPEFKLMQSGFFVKVVAKPENQKTNVTEKDVEKVTEKVTERVTERVTENQQMIIDCIVENPHITSRELASHVGISDVKIRVNIAKLKEKGLLERIGPAKGGHWKVKKGER